MRSHKPGKGQIIGPLRLTIMVTDSHRHLVEGMRLDVTVESFATAALDVELLGTADGAVSLVEHQPLSLSFSSVAPRSTVTRWLALEGRRPGPGLLTFRVRYKNSGFPGWSRWTAADGIVVDAPQ